MAIGWQEFVVLLFMFFLLFIYLEFKKFSKSFQKAYEHDKLKWYMNPWIITIVGIIIFLVAKLWS